MSHTHDHSGSYIDRDMLSPQILSTLVQSPGACRRVPHGACLMKHIYEAQIRPEWSSLCLDLDAACAYASKLQEELGITQAVRMRGLVGVSDADSDIAPLLSANLREYDAQFAEYLIQQCQRVRDHFETEVDGLHRTLDSRVRPALQALSRGELTGVNAGSVQRAAQTLYLAMISQMNYLVVNRVVVHHLCTQHAFNILPSVIQAVPLCRKRLLDDVEILRDVYGAAFPNKEGQLDLIDTAGGASARQSGYFEATTSGFSLGFGIAVLLIALGIWPTILTSPNAAVAQAWFLYLLPIWRAVAGFVIGGWMVVVVFYVVARLGINYPMILDMPQVHWSHIARLVSVYVLVVGVAFAAFTVSASGIVGSPLPPWIFPVVAFAFVAFMLAPLPKLSGGVSRLQPLRMWFFWNMLAVLVSPLIPVSFSANLVGDVLTSFVRPMVDIFHSGCMILSGEVFHMSRYITVPAPLRATAPHHWHGALAEVLSAQHAAFSSHHANGAALPPSESSIEFPRVHNARCNVITNWITPFVLALPYWCRLAQCLRRIYDTKSLAPHLYNAIKYLLALSVAVGTALWPRVLQQSGLPASKIVVIILMTSATIYAALWDVLQDWDFVDVVVSDTRECSEEPSAKNSRISFRARVSAFKHNHHRLFFYGIAIVWNLFARFWWVSTIVSRTPLSPLSGGFLVLLASAIEIVRRGTWAIGRLDNEHFTNKSKFRTIGTLPLLDAFQQPVTFSALDYLSSSGAEANLQTDRNE